MLDFSRRSKRTEIIDDTTLDREVMDRVLGDLDRVNRFLGGYGTTIDAVRRMLPAGKREARILDVGAGGGDTARRLVEWGRATGRKVEVVSVDLSFAAVAFARGRLAGYPEASVVQADVLELPFERDSFDLAVCSLFLHHFEQPAAARILSAMHEIGRYGAVVNDLHRHPLAYAGIWTLTRLLPASPVVRNDGPLSVLRAFDRDDFAELSRLTGLPTLVRWRWAFRYQVLLPKRGPDV